MGEIKRALVFLLIGLCPGCGMIYRGSHLKDIHPVITGEDLLGTEGHYMEDSLQQTTGWILFILGILWVICAVIGLIISLIVAPPEQKIDKPNIESGQQSYSLVTKRQKKNEQKNDQKSEPQQKEGKKKNTRRILIATACTVTVIIVIAFIVIPKFSDSDSNHYDEATNQTEESTTAIHDDYSDIEIELPLGLEWNDSEEDIDQKIKDLGGETTKDEDGYIWIPGITWGDLECEVKCYFENNELKWFVYCNFDNANELTYETMVRYLSADYGKGVEKQNQLLQEQTTEMTWEDEKTRIWCQNTPRVVFESKEWINDREAVEESSALDDAASGISMSGIYTCNKGEDDENSMKFESFGLCRRIQETSLGPVMDYEIRRIDEDTLALDVKASKSGLFYNGEYQYVITKIEDNVIKEFVNTEGDEKYVLTE